MNDESFEGLKLKVAMYEALTKNLEREISEIKHGRNYDDDEAERKLNALAERYEELEHKNKLLKHALYISNEEEEYYTYIPDEDNDLETLASDYPVRISSTWLIELLEDAYEKGRNSIREEKLNENN